MNALYSRSAIDIVKKALSILGVIDPEEPIAAIDRENGIDALNYMIKNWQNQGFHLWTETEGILPLVANRQKYQLGSGGDYCFFTDEFYSTSLSADSSTDEISLSDATNLTPSSNILTGDITTSTSGWTAVDSTLSVSSGLLITNTGTDGSASYALSTVVGQEYIVSVSVDVGTSTSTDMEINDIGGVVVSDSVAVNSDVKLRFTARQKVSNIKVTAVGAAAITATIESVNYINTDSGDYIGVILDNGNIQWSRSNYLSGSDVTLRDTLTSQASSGNRVYYSGEIIDRPLSIVSARYQDRVGNTEIPSEEWSRSEYFDQPDKTSQGIVSQWYYSPQLNLGDLYLWQVASSNQELLRFTYIRPTEVVSGNEDSPDFPSEWFLCLAYNVASSLVPEYSVPQERIVSIEMKAKEMLDGALGNDNEDTYIKIELMERY